MLEVKGGRLEAKYISWRLKVEGWRQLKDIRGLRMEVGGKQS
jgi:hypothetical protein